MTPTDDGNSQVATALFPENDPKQTSFDDMTREIDIGWNNGGMAGAAIGAYAGMAIGCVSIFPNFIAGCIIGNVVGTVVGAVVGIGYGNPDAQPAVEQFLSTP
ncbi:hypothetical protein [Rhodococcus triatomae]|nr:hypothetical protein [Rhodococcus triatomae]